MLMRIPGRPQHTGRLSLSFPAAQAPGKWLRKLGSLAYLSSVAFANIASAAIATTAQYLNNTASLLISTDKAWAAASWVTITFGATTTLDFRTFINCKETLTANVTFAAPSNL